MLNMYSKSLLMKNWSYVTTDGGSLAKEADWIIIPANPKPLFKFWYIQMGEKPQ